MEQFDALKKWKEKYENCIHTINKDGSQSKLGRWLNEPTCAAKKKERKNQMGTIKFF